MNQLTKELSQQFLEATYSTSNAFTGGSVLTLYNENFPLKVAPLNQSIENSILSCDPINSYGSVKQNANATEKVTKKSSNTVDMTKRPESLESKDFTFPKFTEKTLSNGLKVFFVEDNALIEFFKTSYTELLYLAGRYLSSDSTSLPPLSLCITLFILQSSLKISS